jgi:glycosyltransferase involved in cell wall biosynthesis
MRILTFTAGAANIQCDACMRDNTLAAELRFQGHDVTLAPLYMPTRTDETNVSEAKVHFGAVNVFLQQHFGLIRRTPPAFDRIWDSRFALRLAARLAGSTDPALLGAITVSMLQGEEGRQSKELLKLAQWLKTIPVPDIITLPNVLLSGMARTVKRTLGRPLCCVLQGEDSFLGQLREPYRSEALRLIRENAALMDGFAAVSECHAARMSELIQIPARKVRVVPLGIRFDEYEGAFLRTGGELRIGYLARIAPENGLLTLCNAFLRVQREIPAASLDIAGYLGRENRWYLEEAIGTVRKTSPAAKIRYHGAPDHSQKIAFLKHLDVFSLPATYDDPKGIPVLEAMAAGVPAVLPGRGAFIEIVQKTAGGVLVAPDSEEALADAIIALWKAPEQLQGLRDNAYHGVRMHYSAARMAEHAAEFYGELAGTSRAFFRAAV